jgi:glutamate dehydrogenase (NAD(P)+)
MVDPAVDSLEGLNRAAQPGLSVIPSSQPQLMVHVSDPQLGELGYLVIDRLVHGVSSGGIRYGGGTSPAELVAIARSMTYKWAFVNVPIGGAKAGIVRRVEDTPGGRAKLMLAFGRSIGGLIRAGIYYPGVDMGTTADDLQLIMHGAGIPWRGVDVDSAWATSLTVFETIRWVAEAADLGMAGMKVAIEGFGSVGSRVARLLADAGCRIVGASTIDGCLYDPSGLDVAKLISAARQGQTFPELARHIEGTQLLPREDLFQLDVDLMIPGAHVAAIDEERASTLKARIVVPIANAPVTAAANAVLFERGLLVAPDFVANCGGILSSDLVSHGFTPADVASVIRSDYSQVVRRLVEIAVRNSTPISEVAMALANSNLRGLAMPPSEGGSKWGRFARLLLAGDPLSLLKRVGWHLHYRWHMPGDRLRSLALSRMNEWRLGVSWQALANWGDEAT